MMLSPSSQQRPSSWALGVLACLAVFSPSPVAAAVYRAESHRGLARFAAGWQAVDALPGVKPLFGYQDKRLDSRQSVCTENGSNFCFDNSPNDYCGSCGSCCFTDDSEFCCAEGQTCCGGACCASGQTCQNGQCFVDGGTGGTGVTVTVTDTTQLTVSHTATQVVTVVQAVVETSTIFSTTEVTVSNEATQTDTEYVTVTTVEKRDTVGIVRGYGDRDRDRDLDLDLESPTLRTTVSAFFRRFALPWTSNLRERGEIAAGSVASAVSSVAAGTTTTVSVRVTQTNDVTSFVPVTTTVPSTSVVLTTVIDTKTVVLNAETTVTTTSTLTVTSRPPTTSTITETQTLPADSTTSSNPGASSSSSPSSTTGAAADPASSDPSEPSESSESSSSSSLSTGAIAGIAGGIGGAAVLLLVAALVWWLRRRHNAPKHQDPSSYLEPYEPDMSSPMPTAGMAKVSPAGRYDRFSPSAPHHGMSGPDPTTTSSPPAPQMLSAPVRSNAGNDANKPMMIDRYSNMKHYPITDRYSAVSAGTTATSLSANDSNGGLSPPPPISRLPDMAEVPGQESQVYEVDSQPQRLAEMDGTGVMPGMVEMDATTSGGYHSQQHDRNLSVGSELDGTSVGYHQQQHNRTLSADSELDGSGVDRTQAMSPVSPPPRHHTYSPAHMDDYDFGESEPASPEPLNGYRQQGGTYRDF